MFMRKEGQKERTMHENGHGTMMMRLHINGARYDVHLEPRVSLRDALREYIGLSGTKKGCNQGACGAGRVPQPCGYFAQRKPSV
jgi:xanthine dehydrogenase iron-sulfur cluster and FAD-binding subunit A